MPKIVDKTERRRDIAEALIRLVAREGIETVSVRTVAVEAGVSAGAVQKYFSTKEEMFRFALELTGEYLGQRWETVDQDGNLLDVLHRLVVEALPLDDQRRAEVIVVLAFTARAAVQPEWAKHVRESYEVMQEVTADYLRAAQDAGHIRDDVDAGQLADVVLGLVDGFSSRMLSDGAATGRLVTSLEFALRDLLTPR